MLYRLSVNKWSVCNWVDVNRESQKCKVRVQRSAVEPGLDFFTPIPRHGRKNIITNQEADEIPCGCSMQVNNLCKHYLSTELSSEIIPNSFST